MFKHVECRIKREKDFYAHQHVLATIFIACYFKKNLFRLNSISCVMKIEKLSEDSYKNFWNLKIICWMNRRLINKILFEDKLKSVYNSFKINAHIELWNLIK